ncbi:MAG: hypothetical protein HON32_01905 [Francisellaceae bacterium]|jgi:hypothetical protein|nr:hypothetical protein [Francisellaceae bacterium]MBT6539139.1 hypothetical protein [Francisellaceae bacterium]
MMLVNECQKIGTIDNKPLTIEQSGYLLLYPEVMINNTDLPASGIYIICQEPNAEYLNDLR